MHPIPEHNAPSRLWALIAPIGQLAGVLIVVCVVGLPFFIKPPGCATPVQLKVLPAESTEGLAYCAIEGRLTRSHYVYEPKGVYPLSRCTRNPAEVAALEQRLVAAANANACTTQWTLSESAKATIAVLTEAGLWPTPR